MTFIAEVVDHLLDGEATNLENYTVIFPNRRAGLFLKKEISRRIDSPIWAPNVQSLEDFLFQYSDIQKADPLALIFELFQSFQTQQNQSEGFDSFYFWGEMLLRDLEEVDHYLVDPKQLFKYIESDRQLVDDFYFLEADQEAIIKQFWHDFFPKTCKSQKQFMETWRILLPIYEDYKLRLKARNIGYTSHIYRSLYSQISTHGATFSIQNRLLFAGFNALTPVEEYLVKYFISEHGAGILWDLDAYYLDDENQEAGLFLRKYREDQVFGRFFPENPPDRINAPKEFSVTGVTLEVGQAKWIGQQVKELLDNKQALPEDIVIILPQDYMLFPILNSLPEDVLKLNVTMGYPLKETPLFGLLDAILELEEQKSLTPENWVTYYHKPVLDILSHPYLYGSHQTKVDQLIKYIRNNNQVRVLRQDIEALESSVLNAIFKNIPDGEYIAYLLDIVRVLGEQVQERFGLEREFLYHFQVLLDRLSDILQGIAINVKTFRSLFVKASRTVKIPFSGEPVQGLQVMGVLETRNLDFKYVFMPSMNDDTFPATQHQGSFVPYRIRKAFGLPTFEFQDAIYAYLFYRLFQKSKALSFFYNTYADFGLSGEISRFLRQLELESGLSSKRSYLHNSISAREKQTITIQKTPDIRKRLLYYTSEGYGKLTPSAINTYLECRLRFYFKYVLRLFAKDEMSDELRPRDFGNILHTIMEMLYQDVIAGKSGRFIEQSDFFRLENSVSGAVEIAFRNHFKLRKKQRFQLKGRNSVMAEIIKKFVYKTLELDKAHAPFEILSLEKEKGKDYGRTIPIAVKDQQLNIRLGGIIDRVDRKGGSVRVIDYKSGKDSSNIDSIEKVFDDSKRNKAGFQIMYYAMLYASKYGVDEAIIPGIFNIQELFTPDFDERLKINKKPMTDARPYLNAFEDRFRQVLVDIFDDQQPFDQTENTEKCTYCDFKDFCER